MYMDKIYIYMFVFSFVFVVTIYILYNYNRVNNVTTHTVDGYTVLEIDNVLSENECDALIDYCKANTMTQSEVVSEKGNLIEDEHRKSKTMWIDDTEHHVAMKMAHKSSILTKYSRDYQEKLQVVCYEPEGKFDAHYDNDYNTEVATRCCTLLVYLNDDYEGGETEFVKIGVTIRPKKGKGILFWSLDDNHKIIENSMHRGNTVKHGNKWICTKWTHMKPYPGQ